jgi:hypothetical protein
MSRILNVGVEIIEVFTVFNSGTGAEVTGLVNGDFVKVLHKDGVASGIVPQVTEISGGDYKVTFTPNAAGAWRLLVQQSTYNKQGWEETFDVSADGLPSLAQIAAAVWAYIIETGFPASRILRIIAGILAGKSTGGKASFTSRNLGDTENVIVGSADENGNRTPTSYAP